jgi:hypothetical protein
MRKAILFLTIPVCLWASPLFSQEPELEPIPLPEPSSIASELEPLEPTAAIRPDEEAEGTSVEQASYGDELQLEPIPTDPAPPIILHSPVVESRSVESFESAPTIVLDDSTYELPIETPAPVIESPAPIVNSVPTDASYSTAAPQQPECSCQQKRSIVSSSVPVAPPVYRQPLQAYSAPPQVPANRQYTVRQQQQPPVRYAVPQPTQNGVYVDPRTVVSGNAPGMRYDHQGPYTVRQSTEVRPGPGRTRTQVTTYEVTRYRPVTYQVTVPQRSPSGFVVVPRYEVQVQPVAPVPPQTGPIRSWLRRM